MEGGTVQSRLMSVIMREKCMCGRELGQPHRDEVLRILVVVCLAKCELVAPKPRSSEGSRNSSKPIAKHVRAPPDSQLELLLHILYGSLSSPRLLPELDHF